MKKAVEGCSGKSLLGVKALKALNKAIGRQSPAKEFIKVGKEQVKVLLWV